MIATSYTVDAFLSGALSYIAEYKIVFKVFELKF